MFTNYNITSNFNCETFQTKCILPVGLPDAETFTQSFTQVSSVKEKSVRLHKRQSL